MCSSRKPTSRSMAVLMVLGGMFGCEKTSPPRPEPATNEASPSMPAVLATPPSNSPLAATPPTALPEVRLPETDGTSGPVKSAGVPAVVAVPAATAPTPGAPVAEVAPGASQAPVAPVPTASAVVEAPPPPPVESPKQSAQAFSVWLQSSGKYSAGQQGTVEAVVVPKAEFHCNPDYPYKFVTSAASPGVSFPKATVRSEGLSVSTNRAVIRVPFVAQNAGDAKVGGTFHFSVCSESQCVVEKRDVFVTVKVQ